jgi:riboflavin synthase
MFTGLVESTGVLSRFDETPAGRLLHVAAPGIDARIGDSIAVNGCCLTVAEILGETLRFDLLRETLARTNLESLAPGRRMNLERALAANARLGGHFVQGHIDCTAAVLATEDQGADLALTIELPAPFARYAVEKGSIAVNGASLTIAAINERSFTVWIIPHTRAATNLGDLRAGDRVILEFDLLAKYAERLLAART